MLLEASSFYIGKLEISLYGILMAVGMAVGVLVACLNAKKRGLKANDILILACYVLPLSIIGAKIYYVLFSLDKYASIGDVFKDFTNGFAIYGGVIGGAIGVALFCAIHKKNFFAVADIATPSLILGQAIGRVGCYFGGCCYGVEVTNPSSMWFPLATQIGGVWHYSTFFYEALWNLAVFAALMLMLYLAKFIKERGVIMSLYFILYGIGRAIIETWRGDSLMLGSIKVSQLLSILLILFGVTVITVIYVYKYALKKPIKMFEFPLAKEAVVQKAETAPDQENKPEKTTSKTKKSEHKNKKE